MVHNNKLVVSLKVKGKHLRDYTQNGDSTVYLPFGEEYSIFIKNLNPERAVVDIDIDGRNAITGLVVDGVNAWKTKNNVVELERFHDGNQNSGYKFKFIEKTEKIREHRGEGPEDGLITVSWKYEKPKSFPRPPIKFEDDSLSWPSEPIITYRSYDNGIHESKSVYMTNTVPQAGIMPTEEQLRSIQCSTHLSRPKNDAGITAEGSESNQSFNKVYVGALEEQTHSIVIKLKGDIGQEKGNGPEKKVKVSQAVTTRKKVTCKNCGTRQTSNNKFCRECGSNLLAQQK